MPNSAQASAAAFIVGQSESLPMIIPTSGSADGFLFIVTLESLSVIVRVRQRDANAQYANLPAWAHLVSTTNCRALTLLPLSIRWREGSGESPRATLLPAGLP